MISKKKSRRVTVDGNTFRYKVSQTPKSRGIYHLNITFQSEAHNGSKLVIIGLISKNSEIWPMNGIENYMYYPLVTRHEAEWFLKRAITSGWDFTKAGSNYEFVATNEVFGYGFLAGEISNGIAH